MTLIKNATLCLGLALGTVLASAAPAAAQAITTGNIVGTVVDPQGGVLPGATIVATHSATNTTYQAVTQNDGRFSILNVRIGVYAIKATMNGFKDQELKDVPVSLGDDRAVSFKLNLASVSETINVSAEAPPINLLQAGTGGNISNAVKENLPTISRSILDLARTNIYFNPMGLNDDTMSSSVAGRSQRYNSFQIDGAVNNDLFGLQAGGGTPGGSAGTQPISFDAVQELQLVVSPYDVRQGGFSGGGINAVTKSGSNATHGSAYLFGRNQKWVGKGITKQPISTFKDKQMGASLGGKLVQNRAFFFANIDFGRKVTPSGFSVGGTGVNWGNDALVSQFLTDLKTLYGYDLGPSAKDEFGKETNNNKVFVRADFNIGHSQLTVRHNYVDARNDAGFPSATLFIFPDGYYRFQSKTNSTVAQFNSRMNKGVNEFRIALTRVRERRDPQPSFQKPFPNVIVGAAGTPQVRAGRDVSSMQNQLDQDIVEVTDDFTRIAGKHQLTIGTHNEFFKFRNLFIQNFYGAYTFNSLALFEAGTAQVYAHGFSATSDPLQAGRFKVRNMGLYAGDQWRWRPSLTLTYGARVDIVRFPVKPTANPAAVTNFGYATDVVPNNALFSPRIGFNWARNAEASEQIRGGVGLFSGRTPYVWVSNEYSNTGVDFTRITVASNANNRIPFIADATAQYTSPSAITGLAVAAVVPTNEIDLIDPKFKYPSLIRANVAYDRKLVGGFYGTAELLVSKTVNDIRYENLNLQQIGTLAVDGRPVYARNRVPTLADVLLLTNSKLGRSFTVSFEGKRPFKSGLFLDFAYLYGQSRTVMEGVRDTAGSTWNSVYTSGDPNHAPLGISDYDPGHRVNVTATYDKNLGKGFTATTSLFYSGQSGRPYSLLWGGGTSTGSVNGDAQTLNDLLYLPKATDNLVYTNGQYADLLAFLERHPCTADQIGTIMIRNSCRSPWTTTMDARFALGLPFKKTKSEITLDVLNLTNLFSSSHGLFQYANFNDIVPVAATALNGVVTGMNLSTITNPTFTEFTRGDLRSRWQLQLGGRVRF